LFQNVRLSYLSFFRDAASVLGVDFSDAIVNYTRKVRSISNVTEITEENVTSDWLMLIYSKDSLSPSRPRKILGIYVNDTIEWVGARLIILMIQSLNIDLDLGLETS